jgi:hypothetical protein
MFKAKKFNIQRSFLIKNILCLTHDLFRKEARFSKDGNGRSFLDGHSWTLIFGLTLMDAHFWMDAHGRFSNAGRTQAGRRSDVLGRLRTFGKFGHATVTVTLQKHKKYCSIK